VSGRLIKLVAPAALAAAAIVLVLPRVTGSPWRSITAVWGVLTWWQLALLAVLWFAGLVAHSTVLMGAMPGLSRRRALTLNLTGSAVANVLPLGGGLGIGLNYLMARRWGFSPGQFSLFTLLSNVWNVLAKAALPVLAVALLVARDVPLDRRILAGAMTGSALLVTATGLAIAVTATDRGARLAGRVTRVLSSLGRRDGGGPALEARLIGLRGSGKTIVRRSWRRMTMGQLTYYMLCGLLLWSCLHLLGSSLGMVAVLTLFAFERALSSLPFTPGGSGLVEVGLTALAIALNGPHEQPVIAAGVLLYRAFTFGLEIPVGGAWLFGWLLIHRFTRKPAPTPVAVGEAA
jgi:uncharacterized membrane protein YbhN (UPF0104 family)